MSAHLFFPNHPTVNRALYSILAWNLVLPVEDSCWLNRGWASPFQLYPSLPFRRGCHFTSPHLLSYNIKYRRAHSKREAEPMSSVVPLRFNYCDWRTGRSSELVPYLGGGGVPSVGKEPSSFVHLQAAFCTPREQEHFLKLSLSSSGVHIENERYSGKHKHVFYFYVVFSSDFQCYKNRNVQSRERCILFPTAI